LAGDWQNFDHVLICIERGKADLILNGVRYEATEGDVMLLPPMIKHLIRAAPGESLIQCMVHFDLYDDEERRPMPGIRDGLQPDVPERERALERMPPLVRMRAADRERLRRRFRRLPELYREADGPARELGMKAIVLELIALYLRSLDAAAADGVEMKGWVPIERSIAYIHAHRADPELSNARIAAGTGYSPGYLSMLFKEQLGTTIHKYITSVRIGQAKRLIREGGMTLTEIAGRTGFASIHHFSRMFRKVTGVPPSRYAADVGARREAFI
jgi:AraC-like DNA-binding protein